MKTKVSSFIQIVRGSFVRAVGVGLIFLISIGAHAQNLFVSVDHSDTGPYCWSVLKIAPGGEQSVFASGLRPVYWMAANSAGELFGANADNNIVEITPTGVQTFAAGVSGPLAFDSADNLFVAANDNIYKYTSDGVQSTFASGVSGPLAFDRAGNLFVVANDNIYEYAPDGAQSTIVTGLGLTYPIMGLAVDGKDNFFVSEQTMNSCVYEYTSSGTKTAFGSKLGGPCGLAYGDQDHLLVADNLGLKIAEFWPDGSLDTNILIGGGVCYPTALALQPVPEPSILGVLAISITALAFGRRTFTNGVGRSTEYCPARST